MVLLTPLCLRFLCAARGPLLRAGNRAALHRREVTRPGACAAHPGYPGVRRSSASPLNALRTIGAAHYSPARGWAQPPPLLPSGLIARLPTHITDERQAQATVLPAELKLPHCSWMMTRMKQASQHNNDAGHERGAER